MHRPWLVSGKWSRAPASIKKLMAGDVDKRHEDIFPKWDGYYGYQ